MCGGGGSKQKESAQERALAERARARLKEWSEDGYKAVELDQIESAKDDLSGVLKGRANADIEQAAVGVGNIPTLNGVSTALSALDSAKVNANANAREANLNLQSQAKVNAAKVGQDIAAQNDMSVRSAANRGAMDARADLQRKVMLSQAKGAAIGSVVQGATAGMMFNNPALSKSAVTSSMFNKDAQKTDLSLYNNVA